MKIKYCFIIMVAFILAMGCGKEGPQGIPGPAGIQGVAGNIGPIGPAGTDGSIIYSGNGLPSTSVGKLGDYYLDRNTGNLYGPKTSAGWKDFMTLIGAKGAKGDKGDKGDNGATGATGAAGASGSKILSGTGAPSVGLGTIGDFYLDKTGYLLYGPKLSTGWGIATLLRGAQGPQGPQGPAGVPGSQIYSGTGTPATTIGKTGDYYLDKASGNLYGPKTSAGWGTPISLKGSKGDKGDKGDQGSTGATGAAGTPGSKFYSGNGAPANSIGINGDYFIDTLHAVMYGPKTGGLWPTNGTALRVNNMITYILVSDSTNDYLYDWGNIIRYFDDAPNTVNRSATMYLPFENERFHTKGFAIPQDIISNGIVLTYVQYYLNRTATIHYPIAMYQPIPYSDYVEVEPEKHIGLSYYLQTWVYANAMVINLQNNKNNDVQFYLRVEDISNYFGTSTSDAFSPTAVFEFDTTQYDFFVAKNQPYKIKIVLVPQGKVNYIQQIKKQMLYEKRHTSAVASRDTIIALSR